MKKKGTANSRAMQRPKSSADGRPKLARGSEASMKIDVANKSPIEKLQAGFADLKSKMGAHPFLKGMSPADLTILSDFAMCSHFSTGKLIFREGEMANRFYLILNGSVALESQGPDGAIVLVQKLGAGAVLGWSWLFPPYLWHFDARALEPTEAIFFYGTWLRDRCDQDRNFGYEMMTRVAAVVIERLQAARGRLLTSLRPAYPAGKQ